MPETLFVRDFSAGWTPSDDAVDGRANALLQMDNLELDRNGALQLIHGTNIIWSGFSGVGFRMFSRFINTTRYDYTACNDGSIYRDSTQVLTGGNTSIAAFGTAFDYTLIVSGTKKSKDNGSTLVNLGVIAPTAAPVVTQENDSTFQAPYANIGPWSGNLVPIRGSIAVVGSPSYLQCTTLADGTFIIQSDNVTTPVNCTVMNGTWGYGTSTDDDLVTINGYIADPTGVSLQFDILLKPGDSSGDPVSDMYSYAVPDISQQAGFDNVTGVFTISIPRVNFNRTGSGPYDWSTVWGYRLTVNVPDVTSTPVIFNVWGNYMGSGYFTIQGGTSTQNGTYQYALMYVNNTGSYVAKSQLGPASNPITIINNNAQITFNTTGADPQANQVWIFRSGGNLGGTWYRIAVVSTPFSGTTYDGMGDEAALELNITANLNLISVFSIPGTIYDIVGPVGGRWYYFTNNFMYPSDINDPDLVDASIAVRTTGSSGETAMWARAVSASVIVVGTNIDCYLLTGTFSTFPDGTIDVYYQTLGVRFPPITFDAESFGGAVYYMSKDGWRFILPTSFGTTYSSQNNQSMVSPNTDRLYRGETCYEYGPPVMPNWPGSARFPLCIAKNKLWCFPGGTGRGEVWDFVRQYWRTFSFPPQWVSACCATQDNKVLVFCGNDNKVREYDYSSSKLIDGSGQQSYNVLFTYKDNGKPRQRKDTYTFKSRCYTANQPMGLRIWDEKDQLINCPSLTSNITTAEIFVDLSQIFNPQNAINPVYLPKSYLVNLYGSGPDLILEDWSIDYDSRPLPLSFLRLYPTNLGSATQKRLRTWPMVIDTLGNDISFTPDVDGVQQTPTIFNSTYKKTVFHYFTSDIFGIDYGGNLYDPTGLMEVWDTGNGQLGQGLMPDIVQNLPISHKFDQVGPFDILRFGKILRMLLRVSSAGTPIPFIVYLNDVALYTNQFDVVPGVEDDYVVDLPKGVSGHILRVELGPTIFTFNRYYMKFQVAMSGTQEDTELRWVTVPGGGG